MIHYVVIATAVRGSLKVHEPLDKDGQMSAWAAYRLDMTVSMDRVVWNGRKDVSRERDADVDRKMRIAMRVRA